MKDATFRAEQWTGRYDSHVELINRFVDSLIAEGESTGKGWMPYLAPWHGGAEARVLSILRDSGPKTQKEGGSGMLCIENDDPTAAKQCELFAGKLRLSLGHQQASYWSASHSGRRRPGPSHSFDAGRKGSSSSRRACSAGLEKVRTDCAWHDRSKEIGGSAHLSSWEPSTTNW